MKIVSFILMFVGFFVIAGTAGAADMDTTMSLTDIAANLIVGTSMMAWGAYILSKTQD